MYLRTLGGVRLDGTTFTRPKPLLLLAYLAVEGPQHRRRVAELFWPRGADPMKSLGVALARLRKGAPGAVEADDERAWATVGSDVAELLGAYERGDGEAVVEGYRGPFLQGFTLRNGEVELEEWILQTREFLAARVRRAWIERAERAAADGAFEAATEAAERAWSITEAIPEPEELARMHTLLLAGGSPRAAAVREAIDPFDVDLCGTSEEARRRLLRAPSGSTPRRSGSLPARATSFVGRRGELSRIADLLDAPESRLVTVKGPAGVGKSRVALEAARKMEEEGRFPGGVALVELEPLTSPGRIPTAIAEALGLGQRGAEPLDEVVAAVGDRDMLLVFDGFEHLVSGSGAISTLLRACPKLRVLVASRALLRLEEEHVVELGGLPYPQDVPSDAAEALRYDAVRLFAARARQARPEFELAAGNLAAVVETCRAVDGLPLGLELAASWARVLDLDEIAERMVEDPAFFVARHRNAPEGHRSLRRAFDRSWELLGEDERAGMRKAAVFRGGFRRDAAAAVAGLTIPLLASLTETSLLRVDRRGRYGRHPLVYQFTKEKAFEHPTELAEARERHGAWWISFLERYEDALVGSGAADAIRAVEEELENVRAAWRWAAEEGRHEELARACRPLQLFYIQGGGRADEAAEEFARAARSLVDGDATRDVVRGRLLAAAAWFRYREGDHDRAADVGREAIRLLQPVADGRLAPHGTDETSVLRAIASARNTLGLVAMARGDADGARREYRAAMAVAERVGNERQVALFLNNLGLLLKNLGNYAEAERHYRVAIDINRRLGNQRSVVRNLTNLSAVLVHAGRLDDARAVIEEGLELAEATAYERMVPRLLVNAGGEALVRGDAERARRRLTEALALVGEDASSGFRVDALQLLGRCASALGEPEEACRAFRDALSVADPSSDRWEVADTLAGLAEHVLAAGSPRASARILALAGDGAEAPRPVGDALDDAWRKLAEALPAEDLERARRDAAGVGRPEAVALALELSAAAS